MEKNRQECTRFSGHRGKGHICLFNVLIKCTVQESGSVNICWVDGWMADQLAGYMFGANPEEGPARILQNGPKSSPGTRTSLYTPTPCKLDPKDWTLPGPEKGEEEALPILAWGFDRKLNSQTRSTINEFLSLLPNCHSRNVPQSLS